MDFKDLVPTLTTCKRLQKLGWTDKTALRFVKDFTKGFIKHPVTTREYDEHYSGHLFIPAPTSSELGKVLPIKNCIIGKLGNGMYAILTQYFGSSFANKNEAECRALALLWLIENDKVNL